MNEQNEKYIASDPESTIVFINEATTDNPPTIVLVVTDRGSVSNLSTIRGYVTLNQDGTIQVFKRYTKRYTGINLIKGKCRIAYLTPPFIIIRPNP